jgi:uncharacterized protein
MKPSPYNHFFEARDGGIILAFNSYSGAVAEIEKENYPRIQYLLANPDRSETDQDREFLQCLKDGGFLIADGIDQTAALKTRARSTRLEGNVLTLTIAPTLACNFDCDYCFESHSNIRMSQDTQEALLKFTDRYLTRASALRICWFGGEPTLCFSIIERLQKRLLALAEKHRITVMPGAIITNGYLLDAEMAQRLKDMKIVQAQITIDGPEAVHDSRRKLRNGRGSFSRIIDNLAATAEILSINVRINVDKDNVDSSCEVVEYLQQRGILPKIKAYFAQVTSSGAACSNIRDRCYDDEEFSKTLVSIYGRLFEKGIRQVDYPHVMSGATCGAICEGHFVVSPTGHLFRCWEDLALDASKSIGQLDIPAPNQTQKENLAAFEAWDPFKLEDCRECKILPVCMGGCPMKSMQNQDAPHGICSSWKYNFKEMLALAHAGAARQSAVQPDQAG